MFSAYGQAKPTTKSSPDQPLSRKKRKQIRLDYEAADKRFRETFEAKLAANKKLQDELDEINKLKKQRANLNTQLTSQEKAKEEEEANKAKFEKQLTEAQSGDNSEIQKQIQALQTEINSINGRIQRSTKTKTLESLEALKADRQKNIDRLKSELQSLDNDAKIAELKTLISASEGKITAFDTSISTTKKTIETNTAAQKKYEQSLIETQKTVDTKETEYTEASVEFSKAQKLYETIIPKAPGLAKAGLKIGIHIGLVLAASTALTASLPATAAVLGVSGMAAVSAATASLAFSTASSALNVTRGKQTTDNLVSWKTLGKATLSGVTAGFVAPQIFEFAPTVLSFLPEINAGPVVASAQQTFSNFAQGLGEVFVSSANASEAIATDIDYDALYGNVVNATLETEAQETVPSGGLDEKLSNLVERFADLWAGPEEAVEIAEASNESTPEASSEQAQEDTQDQPAPEQQEQAQEDTQDQPASEQPEQAQEETQDQAAPEQPEQTQEEPRDQAAPEQPEQAQEETQDQAAPAETSGPESVILTSNDIIDPSLLLDLKQNDMEFIQNLIDHGMASDVNPESMNVLRSQLETGFDFIDSNASAKAVMEFNALLEAAMDSASLEGASVTSEEYASILSGFIEKLSNPEIYKTDNVGVVDDTHLLKSVREALIAKTSSLFASPSL